MNQYLPDTFGGMTSAFNAGRLIASQKAAAQKQKQLSDLAPAALQGDPAATAQAYALDPDTAKQYGDGALRMGLQLHNIANQLKQFHAQGNEQAAAMLYQQAAPLIRQKFPNAPEQWDANALMPAIDAVVAMTAPGGQQENAAHVIGNNLIGNDGNVLYRGEPAPANGALVDVPDGQGGTMKMVFDPRTRQLSQPQFAGAPQGAPAQQPSATGEVPFSIDPSLPPEVQAQIRADPNAGSAQGITELPQAAPLPAGIGHNPAKAAPQATRTLSPQEMAAVGLPSGTVAQMDGEGNIKVIAAAGNKAADPAKADKIAAARADALDSVTQAISGIDNLRNSGGFGELGTWTGDMLGHIPHTQTRDAANALDTVKNQVLLSTLSKLKALSATGASGFGALSNQEGKILQNSIANLETAQSHEAIVANLKTIRETLSRAAGLIGGGPTAQSPRAATPRAPAVGTIEDGHRFKGGNPADPASWEVVR